MVLGKALTAALVITRKEERARVLTVLLPQLSGKAKTKAEEALAAEWAIEGEDDRFQALTALVPQLSGDLKTAVLRTIMGAERPLAASC